MLKLIIHRICRLFHHYCRHQGTAHRWVIHRILNTDGGKTVHLKIYQDKIPFHQQAFTFEIGLNPSISVGIYLNGYFNKYKSSISKTTLCPIITLTVLCRILSHAGTKTTCKYLKFTLSLIVYPR